MPVPPRSNIHKALFILPTTVAVFCRYYITEPPSGKYILFTEDFQAFRIAGAFVIRKNPKFTGPGIHNSRIKRDIFLVFSAQIILITCMAKKQEKQTCDSCSCRNDADALVCSLCGKLLRKEQEPSSGNGGAPAVRKGSPTKTSVPAPGSSLSSKTVMGIPVPFLYLFLGAVLAPVFLLHPILGYMGWFIEALVHEMGHTLAAWFFGCPAQSGCNPI